MIARIAKHANSQSAEQYAHLTFASDRNNFAFALLVFSPYFKAPQKTTLPDNLHSTSLTYSYDYKS